MILDHLWTDSPQMFGCISCAIKKLETTKTDIVVKQVYRLFLFPRVFGVPWGGSEWKCVIYASEKSAFGCCQVHLQQSSCNFVLITQI